MSSVALFQSPLDALDGHRTYVLGDGIHPDVSQFRSTVPLVYF